MKHQFAANKILFEETSFGLIHSSTGTKFIHLSKGESLGDVIKMIKAFELTSKAGIICDSLTKSEINQLEELGISYISEAGDMRVFVKEKEEKAQPKIKMALNNLISPTGFEIVDTLFKVQKSELTKMTPTEFCVRYKLSRSRMSHVMQAFKSHELVDLRDKLGKFTAKDWLKAMDRPITMRHMTPFGKRSSSTYTFVSDEDWLEFSANVESLRKQDHEVAYGGLTYLKLNGYLRSEDFDLIAVKKDKAIVMNALGIRPASNRDSGLTPRLTITFCEDGLEKEKLFSSIAKTNQENYLVNSVNILRYVWGMKEEESRFQEERLNLLERYLNEAK